MRIECSLERWLSNQYEAATCLAFLASAKDSRQSSCYQLFQSEEVASSDPLFPVSSLHVSEILGFALPRSYSQSFVFLDQSGLGERRAILQFWLKLLLLLLVIYNFFFARSENIN